MKEKGRWGLALHKPYSKDLIEAEKLQDTAGSRCQSFIGGGIRVLHGPKWQYPRGAQAVVKLVVGKRLRNSAGPQAKADERGKPTTKLKGNTARRMDLKFEFASCGQRIAADTSQIGMIAPCPSCGQSVTVPNPLKVASSEREASASVEPAPAPPKPRGHTTADAVRPTSVPKPFTVGEPSWQPFVHFLTASVKEVHPTAPAVGGIWLSPARKLNAAKEIAYQQRRFVDFGKTLLDTQPWVTLLTCMKHRHVEESYELSAASFPEMTDKKFWDELTVDVQATAAAAEGLLDAQTIKEVKELCDHQTVADKLTIAPETLKKRRALQSKKIVVIIVVALFAAAILLLVAAEWINSKEMRESIHDAKDLRDSLQGLAAFLGIGGAIAGIYAWNKSGRYLALFKTDIAPILKFAHVDPASCINNLDYVEQVVHSVCERYRYLQEKLLKPFL